MQSRKVIGLFAFAFATAVSSSGLAADQSKWPSGATIGTGGLGGTYHLWGSAWATLLQQKAGLRTSVEVTGAAAANVKLTNSKELTFGLSSSPPIWEGWTGAGKGKGMEDLRVVIPMYVSYFQAWARADSGIQDLQGLKGKRVNFAPSGATSAVYMPRVFDFLGVTVGSRMNVNPGEGNRLLRDGLADAQLNILGVPVGAITELGATHPIRVFGLSKSDAERVAEKFPFFAVGTIPAGTYAGTNNDITTLTVWNFVVAHKDLPDSYVYEVTKKSFENQKVMVDAHPTGRDLLPENVVHSPIPVHAGAIKYYEEKGVKLKPVHRR